MRRGTFSLSCRVLSSFFTNLPAESLFIVDPGGGEGDVRGSPLENHAVRIHGALDGKRYPLSGRWSVAGWGVVRHGWLDGTTLRDTSFY